MDEGIQILEEKGLLQESKGASIVDLEEFNLPPALIKKSDGATLYITRDMATAMYRARTYHFVKNVYAVGQEQSNHFRQLKAVLKKMGFDWSDDMVHVDFGLVTKNRQKLSTRKGNIILLEPTLQEAISRAKSQIEAKNPELENKDDVAHAVGVGAVKFYDLKTDRRNGYDFDLEAMVSFEGETGPYIQYAYARIQSILRKANFAPSADASYSLNDAESWEIIKLLQDFSRVIKRASDNFDPSLIAKYAISLAQAFNKYYAHTRILDDSPERDSRLALSYSTALVLKEALRLLGVETPEKM
ncbi:Arginyl-tRNA synthetase [Streptococcus sp. DD11]|nr:Arginyl-tRNA synthetase [Streptococcus sp. DD11]